ncbi:hypothetical protein AB1282_00405 [Gottfriedia sp. S16(2024)]|uniref:hypothetical protein n=1 Tax=Gottfriedia sp. S16(2024) TaxID=3162883 RepID=UPI003D20A0C6
MKRNPKQKRSSTLKRKLKYLLLLLLLSFNFSFTFGYVNKLTRQINELNAQVQAQQALINHTETQVSAIQNALTVHEMKINLLSKAEPGKVVQTIVHKVAEHAPSLPQLAHHLPHIDPSAFHVIDPSTVAATAGVVVTVVAGFLGKVGGIIH